MRRHRIAVLAAASVVAAACSDTTSVTPLDSARPQAQVTANACTVSPAEIRSRLGDLFPPTNGLEGQARGRFERVRQHVSAGRMAAAVTEMFGLLDWTLQQYKGELLEGGRSDPTQTQLSELIGKLYCYVALPEPKVNPATLGPDAAVAVVYPNSPDTLIKTETDWAEVFIPAGAIPGNQPVLITIQRIPESQYITPTNPFGGPLFTSLNQYPLFYDYGVSPAVTFNVPVTVGICLQGTIDLNSPPGSRLRVAHNISATDIEILPWAAPPALNCDNIVTASAGTGGPVLAQGGGWQQSLSRGFARAFDWLLPPPLEAATVGTIVRGTCCLGGLTRTFTPFGGVDTLGFVTPVSDTSQTTPAGTPVADPPRVRVTTDTALGALPIPGVTVTFTVTAGGGTLNGGQTTVVTTTDPNGEAWVSSWVVNAGTNQVVATPSYVPGSGFTPASITFTAIGTSCQTQSQIPALECNGLAALFTGTGGASWTNSTGWIQTATPCSWYGIFCLGGALTDVNLPSNNLTGSIPTEIGDLASLEWLNLSANALTGPIPPALGNLSSLLFLQLQNNQLSGAIPSSLGNLTSLLTMALEQNQLSGSIPASLGGLTALQLLNLSGNQLSGAIPAALSGMTGLQQLYLYNNQLTGTVPLAVAQLGGLIQGATAANQAKCQLQTNPGLHVPDQPAYRAADLDGDGAICGLAFTTVDVVDVTPPTPTVSAGSTVQLSATLRDVYGNVLSGPGVTWSTANGAVATVNASGLVTGVAPGTVVIQATSQGKTGVATVTVVP